MPKTPISSPDAADQSPNATHDAPAQIAEAVHALRNGMNALLMNTAVLASRIEDVPESLRPFVESISRAGYRCSEDLARLFALVDTRKR
jgi:signal transduction histidine kinase